MAPPLTHPLRLVCASANPHKAEELSALLGAAVVLEPRPADVPAVVEDAPTLAGNARKKAVTVAMATGRPALADDTGLEVDALGGAPGVRSARFAGETATTADNVARLLDALGEVPDSARTARFRTVVMVAWPDGRMVTAEGVCEGAIALAPRGTAGFGYDPVFVPTEGDGRTFAEMTAADKGRVSHRGRALARLAEQLTGAT